MKAIFYKTKNQRKLSAHIERQRYSMLRTRQIARELSMAISSVQYQLKCLVRKGILVCRAGKYLVKRMIPGAMWTTFARLSRHQRTLNGPHVQVKRGPGRPRKIPLEAV